MTALRLGIDASNLRAGGGVTHLVELLRHAEPAAQGIERVTVWAPRRTLDRIEPRTWLTLSAQSALDGSLVRRAAWQRTQLGALARAAADVLLVPGGAYGGSFRPYVAMSQNMLPFQFRELSRYGASWMFLRLCILRLLQGRTLARADGTIYLTHFAAETIDRGNEREIIPHGVSEAFRSPPRTQHPLSSYSPERPFRFLYTSIIDVYKHQWNVAEAIGRLRADGLPVTVDLVGPSYPPARAKLEAVLARRRDGVRVIGNIAFDELPASYHAADAFLFASSCENLPIILLEAMAAGLPIACSSAGPMPEVLGDAGVYFDPARPAEIARAAATLMNDHELRARLAQRAYERAMRFTWAGCAAETFAFVAKIGRAARGSH